MPAKAKRKRGRSAGQYFLLRIRVPQGVTRRDMKDYLRDAVVSHSGMFPPDHPLFSVTHTRGFVVLE